MAGRKIFISYSHKDTQALKRLLVFIKPLERGGLIDCWVDTGIEPGQDWEREIDTALDAAAIAVLVISQDFLASDFIFEKELPRILARQSRGEVEILPVFFSTSDADQLKIPYIDRHGQPQHSLLPRFQGFGSPAETLMDLTYRNREKQYKKLVDRLRELADKKTGKQMGYPSALIDDLKTNLELSEPPAEYIGQCYEFCRKEAGSFLSARYTENLEELLDYLAALYYQKSSPSPLPLISFVASLSQKLDNPEPLINWLEEITDFLRTQPIENQHIDNSQKPVADSRKPVTEVTRQQTPYLMFAVVPQASSKTYDIHRYWLDANGEEHSPKTFSERSLNELPQIIGDELNNIEELMPHLELFLPKQLLTDHQQIKRWESWSPGEKPDTSEDSDSQPIGVDYPINLRCWERYGKEQRHERCGYGRSQQYWEKHCGCFDNEPDGTRKLFISAQDSKTYSTRLRNGELFFGLHFVPQTDYFNRLLNFGITTLLWPRILHLDESTLDLIDERMKGRPLREIPEAIREVREELWVQSDYTNTGNLSLFWDDPTRQPTDWQLDDVPLGLEN